MRTKCLQQLAATATTTPGMAQLYTLTSQFWNDTVKIFLIRNFSVGTLWNGGCVFPTFFEGEKFSLGGGGGRKTSIFSILHFVGGKPLSLLRGKPLFLFICEKKTAISLFERKPLFSLLLLLRSLGLGRVEEGWDGKKERKKERKDESKKERKDRNRGGGKNGRKKEHQKTKKNI